MVFLLLLKGYNKSYFTIRIEKRMTRIYIPLILVSLLSSCAFFEQFNVTEEKPKEPVEVKKIIVDIPKEIKPKLPLWEKVPQNKTVSKYCDKIESKFRHWGWGRSRCKNKGCGINNENWR